MNLVENRLTRMAWAAWIALTLSMLAMAFARADEPRIVSVGGTVTEIIYALGGEKNLVAVDQSSIYPPEATKLPQVGYVRMLSAEGVLSLHPTLIIAGPEIGPANAVEQIKASGVALEITPKGYTIEDVKARIQAVAKALNRVPEGDSLIAKVENELSSAPALDKSAGIPSVLFLMSRGASPVVAGKGTAATAAIELAGGKNIVDDFNGYKPLNPEAALALNPDWVLTTTLSIQAMGGIEGLKHIAGVGDTAAVKAGRVIVADDLELLGFGPRVAKAITELRTKWQEKSAK